MCSKMAVEWDMCVASFPGHSQMDAGWEFDIFDLLLTVKLNSYWAVCQCLSAISEMMHYNDRSRWTSEIEVLMVFIASRDY